MAAESDQNQDTQQDNTNNNTPNETLSIKQEKWKITHSLIEWCVGLYRKWWSHCVGNNNNDYLVTYYLENRQGYVDMLDEKFKGFLHKTYRYETSVLDIAESTHTTCIIMNECAKEQYPECNIRGNLKMTKFHF